MKPSTIIIIIILFLTKICISCEKLVETEIPNNQIVTNQVFEDVQTANSALAGLYGGLWNSSPLAGDQAGQLLGSYTDDLDCYATSATNGAFDIYRNQQIDNNSSIYTYWSTAYQNIYAANAIIEGVDKSTALTVAQKAQIKGEALLARSMMLFYLQQVFGDIPYPLTTNYQVNQTLSKTPSLEVLARLEDDFNLSADLLTEEYRNPERIFPNRKTAQLMLAKVYMLQNRWVEAEQVLKQILQSPLYQFQTDITKVFTKSGSHILWQLKPRNNGDATKESLTYYFTGGAPSNYALSPNLISAFPAGDLRRQNWTASVSFNGNIWYRADKYKIRSNNTTEYSIVLRLEEVYLSLAEALAKQNKISEALPYINATRQRAGLPLLNGQFAVETLMDEILLENRREFFTEMGHRFLDLKRTNRLGTLVPTKPNWKPNHVVWPLPQKELLLNANLNPQNSGY